MMSLRSQPRMKRRAAAAQPISFHETSLKEYAISNAGISTARIGLATAGNDIGANIQKRPPHDTTDSWRLNMPITGKSGSPYLRIGGDGLIKRSAPSMKYSPSK